MNFIENLRNNKKVDEYVVDKKMPPLYNFLHVLDEGLSEIAYLEYLKVKSDKTVEFSTGEFEEFIREFKDLLEVSGEVLINQSNYRAFNNVSLKNMDFREPVSYKQCRFYIGEAIKSLYKNIHIFLDAKDKNGLNKLDNERIRDYIVSILSNTSETRMVKELLGRAPEYDVVLYDEDPKSILKKVQHTSIDWLKDLIELAYEENEKDKKEVAKLKKIKESEKYVEHYNEMVGKGLYFAHRDPTYIYADSMRDYERDKECVWWKKKDISDDNKASANSTKENYIEKYNIPEELHKDMLDVKKFRIPKKK